MSSEEKDAKEKLEEYMDTEGDNFMGTGMSLKDLMTFGKAKEIERSYVIADRDEQERRLTAVIELSVVLGEILARGEVFGTAILRSNIDDAISGDWDSILTWVEYHETGDGGRSHAKTRCPSLYANFYAILRRLHDSRPGGPVHPTLQ